MYQVVQQAVGAGNVEAVKQVVDWFGGTRRVELLAISGVETGCHLTG